MPSPGSTSATSTVADSSLLIINALLSGTKWGGAAGSGVSLTYSFPWAGADSATFAGPNGTGSYSTSQEQNASSHYGLNAEQQTAAVGALQAWASVAGLTFTRSVDTASTVGDIRFAWSSAVDSGSAAHAYYPDNYYPSGGDVWINAASSSIVNGAWNVGAYNFNLLLHELGHSLGLKHSFADSPVLTGAQDTRQYTVMSYTDAAHSLYGYITTSGGSSTYNSKRIVPDTPMVDDIAAIQYMYGANTAYMTGNDTYTFDPASPFMRTLWDAAGNDTISVANFSKGCIVDLQQGHYSKVTIESASTAGYNFGGAAPIMTYDGTDNLGIAFGCVIENAIGGSGNDTLIGNDAINNLAGGAGNDTLNGGAGGDILTGGLGNDTIDGGSGNDTAIFDGTYASYAITIVSAALGSFNLTGAASGTDSVTGVEFFQFSDGTKTAAQMGVTDLLAPTLMTLLPADNATAVSRSANLVLTFSEDIKAGSGSFSIYSAGGVLVRTIAVGDTSQVAISGSTVTLNPATDLAGATSYYVNAGAGAVTDLAGNAYAGITGSTAYNFTTAAVVEGNPANNDIRIMSSADTGTVGAGIGDDRYILSPGQLLGANQSIAISDAQGSNTLQLIGGLTVVASLADATSLQLTLNSGSKLTLYGANNFTFELGGNPLLGTPGAAQSFATFVVSTLGMAGVPAGTTVGVGLANVKIVAPAGAPLASLGTDGVDAWFPADLIGVRDAALELPIL